MRFLLADRGNLIFSGGDCASRHPDNGCFGLLVKTRSEYFYPYPQAKA